MRLIDADALADALFEKRKNYPQWVAETIGNMPTIDAIELLKEQDAVKPITEHHLFLCPVCKNTLFREQKFCHECGKRIEWEGR